MVIPFRDQLQLFKIPVLGLVPESSSSAPASPVAGQLWLDTSVNPNRLKVYENGGWVLVSQMGSLANLAISSPTANQYLRYDGTNWVNAGLDVGHATAGTLVVGRGGTGITTAPTPGGVVYGASASAQGYTAAGSAGQYLRSNGAGAPTWDTILLDDIPDAWVKRSVRVASTANVAIPPGGTALSIDGVALANGDRVLLKNQTTAAQNGIYIVGGIGSSVTLTRATDMDTAAEAAGARVAVDAGTQGGHTYDSDFKATDTLGTTAMTFNRTADAGQRGVANGYADLDGSTKLPYSRLPVAADGAATANTTIQATDSRLSNSRPPSGTAGGDLTGTYPNPTVANRKVGLAKIAADAIQSGIDAGGTGTAGTAAAGTPALRRIGTAAGDAMAGDTRLNTIAAPNGDVSMLDGSTRRKITNLADPVNPHDAANKSYVDSARAGLDVKESVRFAVLGSLGGIGTYNATGGASGRGQITAAVNALDAKPLVVGDRILVAVSGQAYSGIYVVTTVGTGANGVWDRAWDFDSDPEVTNGASVFVSAEDGLFPNTTWVLTTPDPITIGGASGTAQTWTLFSGAGQLIAGNGLSLSSNTFSVNVDNASLEISGDALRVKALGITNAMLAGGIDLATKVTGILPQANGGMGLDFSTAAGKSTIRDQLTVPRMWTDFVPALTAGVEAVVTHNQNWSYVNAIRFINISTKETEYLGFRQIDANSVGITSQVAIAASTLFWCAVATPA